MRDPQSYSTEVLITVPLRATDPDDVCDRLDDAVTAAVTALDGAAMLDGTGHGDDVFELFVYADDIERLIDALLAIDWPPRSRATVTMTDLESQRQRSFGVPLAGANAGTRTREKTTKLVERAGDWYLFRLDAENQVAVRITHVSRYFTIAYIFGPPRTTTPTVAELEGLSASDALTIALSDRHELKHSPEWTRIGPGRTFDQAAWPIPEFDYHSDGFSTHYLDVLDSRTLITVDRSRQIPVAEYGDRPPSSDVLFAYDLPAYIRYALVHPDRPYPITFADIEAYRSSDS